MCQIAKKIDVVTAPTKKEGESKDKKDAKFSQGEKFNPMANPNPLEKESANDFDYGKNVVMNYDLSKPQEKKKFNRIYSVVKVYDNGMESSLRIRKTSDSNRGQLRIVFSTSRPIQKKGQHRLKILYRGSRPEMRDFTYKMKATKISLTADSGEYIDGKSIIFNLNDFEYTFQQDTGIE